jgi:hypothetical protein
MLKTEVIDFSTVKVKYRNNLFYLIIHENTKRKYFGFK